MNAIEAQLLRQTAVLSGEGLRHIYIGAAVFLCQLPPNLIIGQDSLVIDIGAFGVLLRRDRQQRLNHQLRVGMVRLQSANQVFRMAPEDVRPLPAQFVDAQHQVDLSAVCGGHGLCQRDLFPIFALPVFQFRSGGHCFSGNAEICASVQSAVKPEAISPGVPHKSHIVKIAVIHRRRFRHRPPGFLRDRLFLHWLFRQFRFRGDHRYGRLLLCRLLRWDRRRLMGMYRQQASSRQQQHRSQHPAMRIFPHTLTCHGHIPPFPSALDIM